MVCTPNRANRPAPPTPNCPGAKPSHQVAGQHGGADAVLVTHCLRVDTVPMASVRRRTPGGSGDIGIGAASHLKPVRVCTYLGAAVGRDRGERAEDTTLFGHHRAGRTPVARAGQE